MPSDLVRLLYMLLILVGATSQGINMYCICAVEINVDTHMHADACTCIHIEMDAHTDAYTCIHKQIRTRAYTKGCMHMHTRPVQMPLNNNTTFVLFLLDIWKKTHNMSCCWYSGIHAKTNTP